MTLRQGLERIVAGGVPRSELWINSKVWNDKHKPADVVATEDNPQKSIVPVKFKERYAEHGDSNGDRVALALKAATIVR